MRVEDAVEHHMGEMLWDAGSGFSIIPARVEAPFPNALRTARYPDGTLRIQGLYAWTEGNQGGVIWEDLPVIEVDWHGQDLI